MSHVIPQHIIQTLKSDRCNSNVFWAYRKLTKGNYVRLFWEERLPRPTRPGFRLVGTLANGKSSPISTQHTRLSSLLISLVACKVSDCQAAKGRQRLQDSHRHESHSPPATRESQHMEATPHHEFSALYTSESQLTRALAAKFHHNRQATERYFFSQLTLIATSCVRRRRGITCPPHDDRGQSPRSNPLVPPPARPPHLCVVDYPLFLVA